ncbi:hypothetical protein [Tahibacter aquaticus]|uniref:hypothetical protein n=1 Tax=Tahibacter aquaticus TaxID=520092 RepID=UPI001061F5BA|nr:hypothetical protein [Tahibacter aquaticus]
MRWTTWLAAVALCAVLLQTLALYQLARQLQRESVVQLATLARGDTPYRWRFASTRDLVSGTVFGRCDYRIDGAGLHLRRGSQDCEIGLPLSQALDLRRFGQLVVETDTTAAFAVIVREQLAQPQRVAEVTAVQLAATGEIPLSTLSWRGEEVAAVAAPQRAAMLRLRFATPAQDLNLRGVSLHLSAPWPWLQSAPRSPDWRYLPLLGEPSDLAVSGATVSYWSDVHYPLFLLPPRLRPEQALLWRDQLRQTEPAALLLVQGDSDAVAAEVRRATGAAAGPPALLWSWLALIVCAALLLLLRLRPPAAQRPRALLQAAATLALPLFVVLDLRLGDNPDGWSTVALMLAFAFALSLRREANTPAWHWLGSPRAWLLAAPAPALALLLMFALGQTQRLPPATELAFYLGWALLQQYLVCVVLTDRLRLAGVAPCWSLLAAAGVFALLHAPNAGLMQLTFAGGLLWSANWLGQRALLPLAASHALAASLLAGNLPPQWLRSAEISLRYFL